ncbi:MAG TPA: SbmA/BacA-like family transporter, partial [Vineibacter sp.]|nr:SbmA/BacA-like family transporter [Vineibacter sp.]
MAASTTSVPGDGDATVDEAPERTPATLVLYWRFARGYFSGERRWLHRGMVAALLALSGLQTYVQVRINLWNVDFFNALERKDLDEFLEQALIYVGWIAAATTVAVVSLHVKMHLQISWRQWLTRSLIARWVDSGRHYQLNFMGGDHDNPDQRIADDVRMATELAVEFMVGIIDNLLLLVTFVGVLWTVSGALSFAIGGTPFTIPGYMVWGALIYAGLGSVLAFVLG